MAVQIDRRPSSRRTAADKGARGVLREHGAARHGVAPGRGAVRDREVREEEDIAGAHRRHAHLGFGRIVASEIELPILLDDPV